VGLPRAGNTLFGSLLNQNPRIKVTANSILPDILWQIECLKKDNIFYEFPDENSLDDVMKNIIPNYYQNWDCDVIIDRSVWGLQENINLLKKYSPNEIKFVVLLRDIQEVIASFVHWSENNKPNHLDNATDGTLKSKVDFLLREDSELWRDYWSIVGAKDSGYPCFFIEYKDLVKNTTEVLNSLYEFLEIKSYKHNLDKLDNFNINGLYYDDSKVGSNLHTVKKDGIKLSNYDVNKYLSYSTQHICSTLNFWKDGSLRKTWNQ
tara:strand:- start:99 stop:887 length:789 start_codon:yes stop_codon:yes gene_type:complete